MIARHRKFAAAVALCAGACTSSLQVTKVEPGSTPPPQSVIYTLPFYQFNITATRTLKGCVDNQPLPVVSVAVTATYTALDDPDQTYSIDPMALASPTKISDLKITYFPNSHSLQSVNAAAEDRTAQIISNIVSTLASVGTTIASGGAGAAAKAAAPPCKIDPALQAKLDAQKGLAKAVTDATARVTAATTRLQLATTLAGAGRSRLDTSTLALYLQAHDDLDKATAAQTAAAAALADNNKDLTSTTNFLWPKSGALAEDGSQQIVIPGGLEAAAQFKLMKGVALDVSMEQQFSTSLRLEPYPAGAAPAAKGPSDASLAGLRYRAAIPGHLIICTDSTRTVDSNNRSLTEMPADKARVCGTGVPAGDTAPTNDPGKVWSGAVPQLGQLKVLPYSNGPFQNNVLAVGFNQDGSLLSVEYNEKSARAETVTGVLKDTSTGVAAGLKSILFTGPTDKLQDQVAALTAKNNIIAQSSTLTTAQQVGLIQSNTALLNAQGAYNNAQIALINSTNSLKALNK